MKYDIIVPALIAFGVSVILSPIIIPFLKKLKFGQFVRDDGPESHLKKSGTPTMGGLIILFSIVITSLFTSRIIRRSFQSCLQHWDLVWLVSWMTLSRLL